SGARGPETTARRPAALPAAPAAPGGGMTTAAAKVQPRPGPPPAEDARQELDRLINNMERGYSTEARQPMRRIIRAGLGQARRVRELLTASDEPERVTPYAVGE